MKCERCSKEHDGSFGSGRFCCKKCANVRVHTDETKEKIRNTLTKTGKYVRREDARSSFCLCCGGGLKTHQFLFCSNQCTNDQQYLEYINKWKLSLVGGMSGKDSLSGHIRRYLFEKHDNKCQKCGWGDINPYTNKTPLAVHHIDGDCVNNKESNLELLCPNCHSMTDNYGSRNKNNSIKRSK